MERARYEKAKCNQTAKKLLRREVGCHEEIIDKRNANLSITYSKNSLSSFDENTDLLIIGSMIPDLYYFYFGLKDRMYGSIIDQVKKTNLQQRKNHIISLCESGKIDQAEKEREAFIEILREHRIAFLDLFEEALHFSNDYRDKKIEYYTINHELFEKVKANKNIRVYAASIPVAVLLVEKLGFNLDQFEYFQLYNGGISNKDLKAIVANEK